MYKKLWFIVSFMLLVLVLSQVPDPLPYFRYQTDIRNDANTKADIILSWQEIFKNKPVLTRLGRCEASDGKGGIDLDAYNPKDTDGKEKFGPMQFDKDTFYSEAKIYNLFENPNINNPVQQILLAEHMIADGKWFKWGCWFKIFPR